jgi:drug/metabolite transporter (DMT)-like permease
MSHHSPRLDLHSIGLLLCLAAVWGGSFVFTEVALQEVGPLTVVLHRLFWASLILAAVLWLRGARLPRSPRIWLGFLGMGALNTAIPFSLIVWGQTQIDAGLASILNATTAPFGAVVAGLLLRDEPLTGNKLIGALLAVVGVALILGPQALAGLNPSNFAQLAVLLAALSYACASVWGKVWLAGQPPLTNSLGMLLGGLVCIVPLVLWVEGVPQVTLTWPVWGALWAVAALATALAYGLYFAILARAGAANLMLVTVLIPPFAIGLGVIFLGERLGAEALWGFAVIALGLVVTDGRIIKTVTRA